LNYSDCSLSILLEISPFLQAGFIVPAIGMIILLVVSALISGSEVAFFSMKPVDLEELRMSSEPSSERIISLLEMPDRNIGSRNLLATILVVNNLVNIVIILLSTSVVSTLVLFPLCWKQSFTLPQLPF
jgi:putative hemolysin